MRNHTQDQLVCVNHYIYMVEHRIEKDKQLIQQNVI